MRAIWRYLALAGCLAYLVLLVGLAVAVRRAAPTEDRAITGLGIGRYAEASGIAYLSGQRLACVPETRDGVRGSRCTVALAGQTLEIAGWRSPYTGRTPFAGSCEARYAGQEWPCRIGSRHLGVHWFAYLDEPLGLSGEQLAALRREHFFENLDEGPFFAAQQLLPPLTALVVCIGVLAAGGEALERRPLVVAGALVAALATLPGTFFAVLFATRGFWD